MIRASFAVFAIALATAPAAFAADGAVPVTLDGIIHADSDDTLAFTPDGNTVFFDRSEGTHKTVMVSQRVGSHWSQPTVASFSGQWFDQDPIAAPGSNIWRVDHTAKGWTKPVWIGPVINSDVFIDFASIAGDNTLYFMRFNAAGKQMQFWRSALKSGQYQTPERVILGDPSETLHDPAVALDQSFIVFDSGRVKGGLGRLSIAFRDGDHWGKPIDLGDALNKDLPWGAHLAPDGRNVYVTGNSGIWKISLDPWLKAKR